MGDRKEFYNDEPEPTLDELYLDALDREDEKDARDAERTSSLMNGMVMQCLDAALERISRHGTLTITNVHGRWTAKLDLGPVGVEDGGVVCLEDALLALLGPTH
jgi:hypothetical protein